MPLSLFMIEVNLFIFYDSAESANKAGKLGVFEILLEAVKVNIKSESFTRLAVFAVYQLCQTEG